MCGTLLLFSSGLQIAGSLRGIGDMELAGKFEDACTRIKRDIIFAASLYL